MNSNEKQIVEQVAGVSIATADMTCRLIFRLVNLGKLSAGEAMLILGDEHGHLEDLAKRNLNLLPGSAIAYQRIADRVRDHMNQLHKDTGAEVRLTERGPD